MGIGLAATVIGLLADTVEVLRLGREFREYVRERRRGSKERVSLPEEQESKVRALIGGQIGSRLVDAFISYVEEGDSGPLTALIDEVEERDPVDVAVDVIGRNPEVMYRRQFKRDPDYIYKYAPGGLKVGEFPAVAVSVAKFLELINNLHPAAKKRVILATPVTVGFQVGQLVGTTAKIYPLHLVRGSGYAEVESVVRF